MLTLDLALAMGDFHQDLDLVALDTVDLDREDLVMEVDMAVTVLILKETMLEATVTLIIPIAVEVIAGMVPYTTVMKATNINPLLFLFFIYSSLLLLSIV